MSPREDKLAELGLHLPEVSAPLAAYVPAVRSGNLVFVSGQLPMVDGQLQLAGKVGAEVTVEQAKGLAQRCALNGLAAAAEAAGGLENIVRVVKVVGYVNAEPSFIQHPQVVNGASELLGHVLGDAGQHSRVAIGVGSLPLGAPVEIEMVVEVEG
ncbi:MAG TPA: RidA family protein [Sporichthyaceae bacterium]|nr:RidA family protein [Sporichthyaceae bacterium]